MMCHAVQLRYACETVWKHTNISWGEARSTREGFKTEVLLELIHKDWADISQEESEDKDKTKAYSIQSD